MEGAAIRILAKTNVDSYWRNETTDWEGRAYRGFDFSGTFTINIDHPDFYATSRTLVIRDKTPHGDFAFTIVLKRNKDSKLVIVDVVSKGDRAPVYEARVRLDGSIYQYSGTTNSQGRAVIKVDQGDNYTLKITHYGYEPIESSVKIKKFDDTQREYPLNFEMVSINEFKRTIVVAVKGRKSDGVLEKIRFATVQFTCENATREGQTNGDGVCEFKHSFPPGEEVKVQVNEDGYIPQTKTFLVKTRGISDGWEKDLIEFVLVKEGTEANSWIGVFENDIQKMTIKGSGNSISAHFTYKIGNSTGRGTWVNVKVEGNTATGSWTDEYKDADKSAKRNGSLVATLSGNTLTYDYKENEPAFTWNAGVTPYTSTIRKDATWQGVLTRKN